MLKKENTNISAKIRCVPRWKERSNFDTLMDFNSEVSPAANVTRSILAILEPITLPKEISAPFTKSKSPIASVNMLTSILLSKIS